MPRPTTRTATRPAAPGRLRRAPGPGPVRERILEAALAVLREEGIQRLTQVRVARRAGVRQSHLTYYFPSRTALLDATTARFVETLAAALGPEERGKTAGGEAALAHLARAVVDRDHMRMFVGAIVAADRDPDLRAILLRGTERMEAALARALGGADQRERARAMLATLWGVGLYGFLLRPPARRDPTGTVLAWLELLRKEKKS